MNAPARYGWVCPRCERVHAPHISGCLCLPAPVRQQGLSEAIIDAVETAPEGVTVSEFSDAHPQFTNRASMRSLFSQLARERSWSCIDSRYVKDIEI